MDSKKDGRVKHISSETLPMLTLEQENELTCESLNLLVMGGTQLLRNLQIIDHDLHLHKREKQLVFALDFSDIYTYLWPQKSKSYSCQVTREMLHSKDIKFTLPPGATVEFIRHLKRLAFSNEATRKKLEDLTNKPIVAALLKSFEKTESAKRESILKTGFATFHSDLVELSHLDRMFSRLSYINEMKNLYPFDTFIEGLDLPIEPDSDILRQCEMSLNFRRPGEQEINNYIDAHNYALIWGFSNAHVNQKNTIYFLVTSSPIPYYVFRNFKWTRFPKSLNNPRLPELSLVRHPIQVLYLSKILALGGDGPKLLRHMISNLNVLLEAWGNISVYRRFLDDKEQPTKAVKLPHNKRYLISYVNFRSYYDRIFSPVRAAIESDLIDEENIRLARGISNWAVGVHVSGDLENVGQMITTRLIFDLFDSLTKLTIRTIDQLKKSLKNLPMSLIAEVDTEGVITRSHQLALSVKENSQFESFEVSVIHKPSGELYLAGDIYRDYFAFWWTTAVTFIKFLDEVRRFIAQVRSINTNSAFAPPKKKEFNGIYLYLDTESEPIELPLAEFPDLNAGDLLEIAGLRMIKMVRIATDVGDFCYDFESFGKLSRRAGILSHVYAVKPIGWLAHNTNWRQVPITQVCDIVNQCFENIAQHMKEQNV